MNGQGRVFFYFLDAARESVHASDDVVRNRERQQGQTSDANRRDDSPPKLRLRQRRQRVSKTRAAMVIGTRERLSHVRLERPSIKTVTPNQVARLTRVPRKKYQRLKRQGYPHREEIWQLRHLVQAKRREREADAGYPGDGLTTSQGSPQAKGAVPTKCKADKHCYRVDGERSKAHGKKWKEKHRYAVHVFAERE